MGADATILTQRSFAELFDHAPLFCNGNELHGADVPQFRLMPSHQRLGAGNLPAMQVYLGLPMQAESAVVDGMA